MLNHHQQTRWVIEHDRLTIFYLLIFLLQILLSKAIAVLFYLLSEKKKETHSKGTEDNGFRLRAPTFGCWLESFE
jgi:hypothetical protein